MAKASNILQKGLIFILAVYQYTISPLLGHRCRFYPSCSQYAKEALQQHGILRGLGLSAKRLACCHPLHRGGLDPVPQPKERSV